MVEPGEVKLSELLAEVHRIEVQSNRLVTGVMAGSYSSVFRGSGVEFDEVREYAEGDDPRTVDWNVTARIGRPYVKKYVDERELTVMFVLDLSASMTGGFGHWSARQVGLITVSDSVNRFVPPRKGSGHALRIVRDCLALPASGTATDLVPALELASRVLRRHAIVFVVSDFLTDGWQHSLALCAQRHDVIAVRLLTPELSAPDGGLLRGRDPESGFETVTDWGSPRVRQAYAERVAAWDQATKQQLRRARVDRIDVEVPRQHDRGAVVRPILRFFRMREQRGAKR